MIKFQFGFLLIVALVFAFGCSDEDSKLGNSIFPSGDNMIVNKVTLKPSYFSQYHPDSIRSNDKNTQGSFMLGGLYNEDFGTIKAAYATQLRFDSIKFDNNSSWVLDSISLHIIQNDIFGDSFAINEMKVFELKKDIDKSSHYSNVDETEYYDESDLIGSRIFRAGVRSDYETVVYITSTDSVLKFINIPLDIEFGKRIVNNVDSYRKSVDSFQDIFKGIFIKPTVGNKALSLMQIAVANTDSTMTGLALYFTHNTSDGAEKVVQTFYMNNECGQFAVLEHDFPNGLFETSKENISPDIVRLRGAGALDLRVKLPNLVEMDEFKELRGDSNFIVNKAMLTLKVAKELVDLERFVPPTRIGAKLDNNGVLIDWSDNTPNNSTTNSYFGGNYNSTTYEYTFNITRYVQTILRSKDEETRVKNQKDLIFSNYYNLISPNFAMFYGKDSVDIEITYTKY